MPTTKEFREFFLRSTKVTSGSKADQENGFATKYIVKGVEVFNRFLANHFPSEAVIRKLFESITFKLNPEDTASSTVQGLVKKSTDAIAEARTGNPSSDMTISVVPHQLPDLVLTTDGDDAVQGTPVEEGGIKLSLLKRTLTGGLFRRNFKLEVNPDGSIVIDGSSKKLKLSGDVTSPGANFRYGTNSGGVKTWLSEGLENEVALDADFNAISTTAVVIVGSVASTLKSALPVSVNRYRFRVWLPVTLSIADGCKINIVFSGTASHIMYDVTFRDNTTLDNEYVARRTAFNQNDNFNGFTNGTIVIEGSFLATAPGDLEVHLGTQAGAGPATAKDGGFFTIKEITRP